MNYSAIEKTYHSSATLPKYGSIATLRSLLGPARRVLDVGCASGYLGHKIEGVEFYGIDGNELALAEAAKSYVAVSLIDLNRPPSQRPFEKEFDVIVFGDILEHLVEPSLLLQACQSWLAPGGRILVSLPNVALWRIRFDLLRGRFDYQDYGVLDRTHLHFFTFRTARVLVEEAGFTILRVLGAANSLGFLARRVPALRNLVSINVIIEASVAP